MQLIPWPPKRATKSSQGNLYESQINHVNCCSQNTNKYKLLPLHHGSSHYINMSLGPTKKPWFHSCCPSAVWTRAAQIQKWNCTDVTEACGKYPLVSECLWCHLYNVSFQRTGKLRNGSFSCSSATQELISSRPSENFIKVHKKISLLKFSKWQE